MKADYTNLLNNVQILNIFIVFSIVFIGYWEIDIKCNLGSSVPPYTN